jgi:phage gpG-like protein
MPDTFSIELTSEAKAVIERLGSTSSRLGERVSRAVDLQNELTIGHAQANKLSTRGPTTLGVRTNRLRSSLRRTPAVQADDGVIVSSIGTNVVYAAVHEYGIDQEVAVRAHTRKVYQAFGQPLKRPVEAKVSAFRRRMKMPERAFIRSSLAERASAYTDALSAAVVSAANEG